MNRRFAVIALCAAAAWAASHPSTVHAQTTRVIVPYPAGQLSDLIGRTVRETLVRQTGGSAIVENVAGAGGAIGAQQLLNASVGSDTLLLASPNEVILAPLANAAVKYRPEDFRLVALVASAPLVLLARADLGVADADGFVEAARRSSRTQPLSYGSVGIGSLYHLMGEQLSRAIGAELTHVPYKGGVPLLQDMAGGRIDFAMLPWSQALQGMADQGRLRLLGTVATKRATALPNLPTVNEGRLLKDFSFDIWTGFAVHRDTPAAVRERWHRLLGAVLADPGVQSALEAQGLGLQKASTLAELDAFYEREVARFRRIAVESRLVPQ